MDSYLKESNMTQTSTPIQEPIPGCKYFDLDEAERSIVYISKIVKGIVTCRNRIIKIRKEIEALGPDGGSLRLEEEFERVCDKYDDLLDEIDFAGAILKDPEHGIIEFPMIHENRVIHLIWRLGRDGITTWHEPDSGFSVLKSVLLLQRTRGQKEL